MRFKKHRLAFVLLVSLLLPLANAASESGIGRFDASDSQLRGLIEILLAENPGLSSASARSQSLSERVPQRRSLPDPQLNYRYFAETPETRVGPQQHMLEFSQGVPWGGKRKLQASRAEFLAADFNWQIEDLERRLVADLKRAYYEAAYLQEALEVNLEEQELLRRFEVISLKRYATGQGIQQNVIKVQTEITRLLDRETHLRERLDIVVRSIAQLIGRADSALTLQPIDLRLPTIGAEREELEGFALAEHPRVRSVVEKIEADRVWKQRRKLESEPDFLFGLGYTLVGQRDDPAAAISPPIDNGQDILALSVGVKIPVYRKRIRAGVAEALESERANQQLLLAVRDHLRFEIQDAMLRLDSMGERGSLYAEVIIPQAEESLASAEAAYSTDRLPFLDLLDAQRVLFQSRLAYHRIVADCWIALADLERSAARPVPSARQHDDHGLETKTGRMQ